MKQITLIYNGYFENNFVVENVGNNFAVMIAKGLETQNSNIVDWYITDLNTNEIVAAKIK